jgi:hypothetical protein
MRVTINPTLDMVSMTWLSRPSYEYFGPVMLFKGDKTAQGAEEAQSAFDQKLMSIFGDQYGKQSQIFNFLTGKMQATIAAGGQGMPVDVLAATRTQASDVNAQQGKNAQQAFANRVSEMSGGSKLAGVAGNVAQGEADIAAAEASQEATTQNNITLANEQLRQQNYWNATNILTGQQAAANPLGYASGATSGTGAVSDASKAVTAANGPGVGQILGGVATGALSAAGQAGGFGALFGV